MRLLKNEPVAFFNLVVLKEDQATAPGAAGDGNENKKTTLKTSKDKFFFQISLDNERANRLRNSASGIAGSQDVIVASEIPTFEATTTESDQFSMASTFSVCRLLACTIQAGGSLMASHGQETTVFQINHARILEPKGNEHVFTNNRERLFP